MTTTSGGRPPGEASTRPEPASTTRPPTSTRPEPPAPTGRPAAAPSAPGAVITPAPASSPALQPRQRRVRLTVTRIDPWTVLRLSFLLSIAAAVITVVALLLLWLMLAAGGVFTSVDGTLDSVLGEGALTVTQYFSFGKVLAVSLLIGAIDVVLITALATIGAFLFNVAASLVGGLEISATEDP